MPTSLSRAIAFAALVSLTSAANSEDSSNTAAQIKALGLPSFEGKTTLKDDAGRTEAMMLAANALGGAVKLITPASKAGPYLVLAGDENVDFSVADSMLVEINSVRLLLKNALAKRQDERADVAAATAALSAVAGLLRAETEVSTIDLAANLPNRLLAAAVAAQINGYLPSASIRAPIAKPGDLPSPLAVSWDGMLADADKAATARKAMGDKPKDKARADRLDHALARFKSLFDRATTANAQGVAPITTAIRLERLAVIAPRILRVYVEQTGGTFVSTKNLATFVGFDPMKVSGAVLVSYTVTDPTTGKAEDHHVISCRPTFTSLRKVQAGSWKTGKLANGQQCEKII